MAKRIRVWAWLLIPMLLAAGGVLAQLGGGPRRTREDGRKPRPKIGEVFQDFTLKDVEGKKVKFSSFRGKKILVLELGACT